jgi:hypothetical protein
MKLTKIYTGIFLFILIGFFLFLIQNISASDSVFKPSNESIQAKHAIDQAKKDINEMISKDIPTKRADESYQEALQIYSGQIALEEKDGNANYDLVMKDALEVSSIKKSALEAKDELEVFMRAYEKAQKNANLSAMQDDYNQIISSFSDERFEDTLNLINKGYNRISEIQSSQTAVKMIYLTTSGTIKNFFAKYGLKLLIIIIIVLILTVIFWNTIVKLRMKIKLNNFIIQKKAINGLIKEMQKNYFKTKKMSETEYNVKLKKYEELIRDIDRQVMVLKEEMFKRDKKIRR